MSMMFWLECSKSLKSGTHTYLEKIYLSNTMDKIQWMKSFVTQKIEQNNNLKEMFGEKNLILPDGI